MCEIIRQTSKDNYTVDSKLSKTSTTDQYWDSKIGTQFDIEVYTKHVYTSQEIQCFVQL